MDYSNITKDFLSIQEPWNHEYHDYSKEMTVDQLLSQPIQYDYQPLYPLQMMDTVNINTIPTLPFDNSSTICTSDTICPSDVIYTPNTQTYSPVTTQYNLMNQYIGDLLFLEMDFQPSFPTGTSTDSIETSTIHVAPDNQKQSPQCLSATLDTKITSRTSSRCKQLRCINCNITKTPLWRRTPDRSQTLCNACGLYYKQYNKHRPLPPQYQALVDTQPEETPIHVSGENRKYQFVNKVYSKQHPTQSDPPPTDKRIECINCLQTQTPLWRKNEKGKSLCNACGLYLKLHHRNRPIKMKKSSIQKRRRDWSINNKCLNRKDWMNESMIPLMTIFLL